MGLTQTHGLITLESGAADRAERGYLHPIQVDRAATEDAHAELLRPSHETGLNPAANARAFVERRSKSATNPRAPNDCARVCAATTGTTQDRTCSFMRRMALHPAGVATALMIAPNMIP
jgi:hypothetical protein